MTARILTCVVLCCGLNAVPGLSTRQALGKQTGPVRIAFRPTAKIHGPVVTLAELADVSGGSSGARTRIKRLDLALDPMADPVTLTRQEVVTRLLVAGYTNNDFQFIGPREAQFHQATPFADRETLAQTIADAVSRRVAESLNIPPADVIVEVSTSSLQQVDFGLRFPGWSRVMPLDHGDDLIGDKQIELGVFDETRLIGQFQLPVKTSYSLEVPITRMPVERGQLLSRDNVFFERRTFDSVAQWKQNPTPVVGETAANRLRALQVLSLGDVAASSGKRSDVVIRSRDLVTVVVQRGNLQITMSGVQALKSGRVGDVIPLKNMRSNKTIFGRVTSEGVVELSN